MPDIVRLRYVGGAPVDVPAIAAEKVEPDHIVEFPGKVLDEGDGFTLIASGNPPQERAWPTSLWRNETPVATGKKSKE